MRERVDLLEEELRQMRAAFRPILEAAWDGIILTETQRIVLEALSSGRPLPFALLHARLQAVFPQPDGRTDNTVSVMVCKLRWVLGKLQPPIAIDTLWGFGYQLNAVNTALLAARRV